MQRKISLNYKEWLHTAYDSLRKIGIENSQIDAEYILSHVVHIPRLELKFNLQSKLTQQQEKRANALLKRRLNREPLQYIIGSVDFYGLEIRVNRNVLIPRPETELLIDIIHKENQTPGSILDIGAGSGAIALALKNLFPNAFVMGIDVSEPALKVAHANAKRLHIDAKFRKSDLFLKVKGKFDIIVSNPPYLSESEYHGIQPELRDYEPKSALVADEEGLAIYRNILEQAHQYLNPGGRIYFEIGNKQADAISFLAQNNGYTLFEKKQDYND
ncbi:MAG TPA: peptide chain release factor N(5)-glutamine methyltransferase, partial [Candidatus Cloacimonadota bacterium]|nr:peptide chain release factor N(5)-glutamine methyltransferase [Candidatus Cloacimonadota bacterium]